MDLAEFVGDAGDGDDTAVILVDAIEEPLGPEKTEKTSGKTRDTYLLDTAVDRPHC